MFKKITSLEENPESKEKLGRMAKKEMCKFLFHAPSFIRFIEKHLIENTSKSRNVCENRRRKLK